ncbi:MAG: transposase [Candidatus Aenigmarchaeota archaeon]|nr:transposase [Candidatus Aenigmarchaeota archaeon]
MNKAYEIVRLLINKKIVHEKHGRGRKGYGVLRRVRLLAYAMLKRIHTDKGLIEHLKKNPRVTRILGFKTIPHRTTIGRWKNHSDALKQTFNRLSDMIQSMIPTELLIVDSTPLEDDDPDARVGFYSRGPFKGFKTHSSINQAGIPLRAEVTTGNRHDCPLLPKLLVKSVQTLGDSGYDSKSNRKAIRSIGSKSIIAKNRRRSKKRRWVPKILKKKRYIVEQFNSLLKEVLRECWKRFRGLEKKASVVYSALISILLIALQAMIRKLINFAHIYTNFLNRE